MVACHIFLIFSYNFFSYVFSSVKRKVVLTCSSSAPATWLSQNPDGVLLRPSPALSVMTKLYGLGLQISLTPATVAQCKDSPWSCRMTPTMRSSRLLQQELVSRGQHERATTWYDVLLELKLRCPSKLMSSQYILLLLFSLLAPPPLGWFLHP